MEIKTKAQVAKHPLKRFVIIALIGMVAGSILSFSFAFSSWKGFWIAMCISVTIWLTQWYGQGSIYELVNNWFGWKKRVPLRLLVHAILSIAYASFGVAAVTYVFGLIFGFSNNNFWSVFKDVALIASIISTVITVIMAAIGFYKSMKSALIERENMRSEMLSYKYESLRNQINPHFLFNSLNVLTSLVEEEPKVAVKFIRQLSDVYRYVLDSQNKELVTLAEEKLFIESFIFLLKIRFEDGLQVQMDVPESALVKAVVPMSLQLLVENAVKHNEVNSTHPLKVVIGVEENWLFVKNQMRPKQVPLESKRVGLQNIRQRYDHFSNLPIEVINDSKDFEVRLPLLNLEDANLSKSQTAQ